MPPARTRKECETPDKSLPGSVGREGKSILKRRQRIPLQEVLDLHFTERDVTRSSNRRVSFAVSEVKEFRQPVNEGTLWGNSYIYDIQKSSSESEHTESSTSGFHTYSSGNCGPGLMYSQEIIVEETISVTIPHEDESEDLEDDLLHERHSPPQVVVLVDNGNQTEESIFKHLEESSCLKSKDNASCADVFPNKISAVNSVANKVFSPNDLFLQPRLLRSAAEETMKDQRDNENTSKLSYKHHSPPYDDSKIIKKKKIGVCSQDISLQQWLKEIPENTSCARRHLLFDSVDKQLPNTDICTNDVLSLQTTPNAQWQKCTQKSSKDTVTRETSDSSYLSTHFQKCVDDEVITGTSPDVKSSKLNEKENIDFTEHALDLSANNKSNDSNINDGDMSFTLPKGLLLSSLPAEVVGTDGTFHITNKCVNISPQETTKKSLCTTVNNKKYFEECSIDKNCHDNSNTLSFTVAGGGLLERKNICNINSTHCDNTSLKTLPLRETCNQFQDSLVKFVHSENSPPADTSVQSISQTVVGGRILVNNCTSVPDNSDCMNITDSISPTVAVGRILDKDKTFKSFCMKEPVSMEESMSQTLPRGEILKRSQTSIVLSNIDGGNITDRDSPSIAGNITDKDSPSIARRRILNKVQDTWSCHVPNANDTESNMSPKRRGRILNEEVSASCHINKVNITDRSALPTVVDNKILCDVPISTSCHVTDSMNVSDQIVSARRILNKHQALACHVNASVNVTDGDVSPTIARGRILDDEQTSKYQVNNFRNTANGDVSPTIVRRKILNKEQTSTFPFCDFINVANKGENSASQRILEGQTLKNGINNFVNVTDDSVSPTTARGKSTVADQISGCVNSVVNVTHESMSLTTAKSGILCEYISTHTNSALGSSDRNILQTACEDQASEYHINENVPSTVPSGRILYTDESVRTPDDERPVNKRPCYALGFTPMGNNQNKFQASMVSNESNTDLLSPVEPQCIVEKWIKKQKSKKCGWEMEVLSPCKMKFHFLEKNVQVLVEIDVSTSTVREVEIVSHLKGNSMKQFMHGLFIRRVNPNSLEERFPSKNDIPALIKFVSAQEEFLLDFCQDFLNLNIAHDVQMKENSCVEFEVNSMLLCWLFTIKIDFSSWNGERLHSRYVEVYPIIGDVNPADIKRLVRAIPGGPHFLKEYIDHLYDYIQAKEMLEGNEELHSFDTI